MSVETAAAPTIAARRAGAAIAAVAVAALAFALVGQFAFGLEPCILCLYQRVPYGTAALLGAAAWLLPISPGVRRGLVTAAGVVFLLGAGLAFYHVGVEEHWWQAVTGCGGAPARGLSVDDLAAQLAAGPAKPCDQVDWRLFGLSLAGYNALTSLVLAIACLIARHRLGRTASP